jgi:enterochelin esterase-like enzyme
MQTPAFLQTLDGESSIDQLIAKETFPLVEPGTATFLYRGEADAVALRPMIAGFPGPHSFNRVNGHDLWWLMLPLPDGARIEYKLEVLRNHQGEWLNDPLNPLVTHNPFGTNSVCRANGYQVPDWAIHHQGTPVGSFEDMWVPSRLGGDRKITVYRPAHFEGEIPLVFVHDGGDYLTYGSAALVLDNFIHRGLIQPAIVAFSWPGQRLVEYAAHEGHAGFVVEEALPRILDRYSIGSNRVVMGASLGAVAAMHTAWVYADAFSGLVLQSGTFSQTGGWGSARPVLEPIAHLLHRLETSRLPERVFISCGTYERMIGANRAMASRLERAGKQVLYEESRDGHTWEAWRDRLASALGWVLV